MFAAVIISIVIARPHVPTSVKTMIDNVYKVYLDFRNIFQLKEILIRIFRIKWKIFRQNSPSQASATREL